MTRLALCFFLVVFTFGCQEMAQPSPQIDGSLNQAKNTGGIGQDTSDLPRSAKLIREAFLSLEVESCDQTVSSLNKLASDSGGYVLNVSTTSDSDRENKRSDVVLRIPEGNLDGILDEIKTLALAVENERITTTDVTEEFVDLEARLQVKRSVEGRYIQLLEQATDASQALEIERSLGSIREEIERLEGRQRYLTNRIELSTITLDLHEPSPVSSYFARAFSMGMNICLSVLFGLLVLVVGLSPFIVLLVFGGWILRTMVKRRRRRDLPNSSF